ncbi:MAG TPA: hypothetical protein VMW41_02650 [Candidatus Bathyarchaeia archaeon]|nr:hypothetical protein [Candidatus Bathyarchaeia archaeon]
MNLSDLAKQESIANKSNPVIGTVPTSSDSPVELAPDSRIGPFLFGIGIILTIVAMFAGSYYVNISKHNETPLNIPEMPLVTASPSPLEEKLTLKEFSQRVAYVRGGDIYLFDTTKATEERLTETGLNTDPKWSPDGKFLAWIERTELSDPKKIPLYEDGKNIVVYKLEDKTFKKILPELPELEIPGIPPWAVDAKRELRSFDWAPDSQSICYARDGVGVINVDGSKQKHFLTNTLSKPFNEDNPFDVCYEYAVYSPDNKRILLSWLWGEADRFELIDTNGRNKKELLPGRAIYFTSWYGNDQILGVGLPLHLEPGLYLLNIKNNKLTSLNNKYIIEVAVDPKNLQIAMIQYFFKDQTKSDSDRYDLFLKSPSSSDLKQLTADQLVEDQLAWSDDGRVLAYVTIDEPWGQLVLPGDLWLLDTETGQKVKIADEASQPVLKSLPRELSEDDWQTFEKFGLRFNYPSLWSSPKASQSEDETTVSLYDDRFKVSYGVYYDQKYGRKLTLAEYLKERVPSGYQSEEDFILLGFQGKKFSYDQGKQGKKILIVLPMLEPNKEILTISYTISGSDNSEQDLIDQLLSTLEYIKAQITPSP